LVLLSQVIVAKHEIFEVFKESELEEETTRYSSSFVLVEAKDDVEYGASHQILQRNVWLEGD
jgi:hypothetical protein